MGDQRESKFAYRQTSSQSWQCFPLRTWVLHELSSNCSVKRRYCCWKTAYRNGDCRSVASFYIHSHTINSIIRIECSYLIPIVWLKAGASEIRVVTWTLKLVIWLSYCRSSRNNASKFKNKFAGFIKISC